MATDQPTDDETETPEQKWVVNLNKLLYAGLKADLDRELMAKVFINSARELWDFYGVNETHTTEASTFQEFVALSGFESADVEDALDFQHGRAPGDWERGRGTDHLPADEDDDDTEAADE